MKHLLGTAIFSLGLMSAAQVTEHSLDSFAQGMELVAPTAGLQTMLIPDEVYRGMVDGNLADLRVFNAAGEPVPHALRTWVDEQAVEYGNVTRPLFAIHRDPDASLDELTLKLTRTEEGNVLDLTSAAPGSDDSPGPVVAHIIDLTGLARPVNALSFILPGTPENFLCRYSIESSPDLSTWTTIEPEETLASTTSGDARLLRTRAELPQTSGTYLRIQWLTDAPPVELREARLELAAGLGTPQRRSVRLAGTARESNPLAFDYPSPGALPVSRVQVHLPESNTVVTASVVTSTAPDAPTNTALARSQFFRTGSGGEFQNSPYPIRTRTAPSWSVFVQPGSSGLGGAPELELEYSPHQLAFMAKADEGPFTLAFGKYGSHSGRMSWASLTKAQPGELATETVIPGAIRELAGPDARLAPEGEGQTKLYILWGVLLAGVALLAGLSMQLVRKMSASA